MELVIKIPEEIYNYIHNEHISMRVCDSHKVAQAIANGIPLPKVHGELIDRNLLNKGLREQQKSYEHTFGIRQPINEAVKDGIIIARTHIDDAPTIIESDKGEQ